MVYKLTENMRNGILPLNNDETLNFLRLKHPDPKDAHESVMLSDIPERIHPVKFEVIDAEMIRKAAMKTRGGSGPSGLDPLMAGSEFCYQRILVIRLQIFVKH